MSFGVQDKVDRVKLARICEMLRSDNANERATAGRLATDLLQRAGLTWTSFICQNSSSTSSRSSQSSHSSHTTSRPQSSDWSWETRRSHEPRYVRHGRRTVADLIRQLDKISGRLGLAERWFLERLTKRAPEEGLTLREWEYAELILKNARTAKRRRPPTYKRTYTRA
jgi:hypothetical protein